MENTIQGTDKTNWLRMDIQTFANEHPFAEEPTEQEPHPYAEEPGNSIFSKYAENPNPLTQPDVEPTPETPEQTIVQPEGQGNEDVNGGQGEQGTQEKEVLDFSGRKVEVIDPIIGELHKDYTNLNKTYQQANQELQQYKQMVQDYQALQQERQQVAHPTEQQQPKLGEISPERMQELNEGYLERMYENKVEADRWYNSQPEIQAQRQQELEALVNSRVNEIVGPIQQERELHTQIQELQGRFQDFDDVSPKIQELLTEQPELANMPNALEAMYYMAKGRMVDTAPTPESMLQNPQFQEQIVQNPQIQQMILQNYQKSKLEQHQTIPTVIGKQAGAQTSYSAGDAKPKTLAEASEAVRRWMGQQ